MRDGPSLDWSEAEAEVAKDEFCACRPVVSRSLALGLWRYWQATAPDSLLFTDPAQNVALLLHAQAYGASIPHPGDRHPLGQLLLDQEELFDPVAPAPLAWGPRANLSQAGWPAVESPVMDAWIYRDGVLPSGVLIVGDGLPDIREQLLPAAFLVSLGMGTLDTDMVNNGVIRVDLQLAGRPSLKIPVNLLGAHPGYLPDDVPEDARQALHRFVRMLRYLADSTGLIRLHEADVDAPAKLHDAVLDRVLSAERNPSPVLWAPGLSTSTPTTGTDAAALLPYAEIPSGAALQMSLSGDLLSTAAYRGLERIYRRATIDRIKTDVMLRRDFNTREAERLDLDHEAYKSAPRENRRAIWGTTVLLDRRYDPHVDRTVTTEPRTEDAERYYLHNVPRIAQNHRNNAILMGQILDSIVAAEERHDSPVRRLAAGRLLDAAVRGCDILDNPPLAAAFEAWSGQVRPMLWLEWRSYLAEARIDPADVFTRNSVILTGQADGDHGRELHMVPYNVVHQQRTAALIDKRRRRVTVYYDAARTARAVETAAEPSLADDRWRRVEELATPRGSTDEDADIAVTEALAADPVAGLTRILEVLTDATGDAGLEAFDTALGRALDATTRLRALRRAATALSRWAPQTARTQLAMVGTENPELGLRAALMEAALEYLAAGGDPRQASELAAGIGAGGHERVTAALHRARELNSEYTTQWLGVLNTVDFSAALGRLQHGLPSLEDLLTNDNEFAAWTSRVGVEAARLARSIEQAADSLDEDGEPVAVALAKLGMALEESFLDEFAGANRDAAHELMAILTGTERRFGQGERE